MISFIEQVRYGKAFLEFTKNPNRTDKVFEMMEIGLRSTNRKLTNQMLAYGLTQSGFVALLEQDFCPELPDLKTLAMLPRNTLGYAYANHMKLNQLEPDFFPARKRNSSLDYLVLRLEQTHDIWHVLTGYDTSVKGEFALQAFSFAQSRSGLSSSLLAAGILHFMTQNPEELSPAMDLAVKAYERGKVAKYLLGIPWERLWDLPLEEVKRMGGIQ